MLQEKAHHAGKDHPNRCTLFATKMTTSYSSMPGCRMNFWLTSEL